MSIIIRRNVRGSVVPNFQQAPGLTTEQAGIS